MRVVERVPVVDTDTHVTEPPDLWTSRLPRRWSDLAPRTVWDERRGEQRWVVGDSRLTGVAGSAMAGWKEFPPHHPPSLEEADRGAWDPKARLERMDEYGIWAQVLYPNLIGFFVSAFLELGEPDLMLACVQAYNDFLTEFASADPERFVPVAALPYWDIDASLAEMDRCAEAGHRGVLFAGRLETAGLPRLVDPHWDPIWAAAQERRLPVNFHIGFDRGEDLDAFGAMAIQKVRTEYVTASVVMTMANLRTIANVINSGICHRFPNLDFVSVESGVGWLPYLLESLDWQWLNSGAHDEFPERELPSYYFRRQVYGCFWFESEGVLRWADFVPDNIMYSTDYPHPTSMSPGPASYAVKPSDYIEHTLGTLPEPLLRKVLYENAARVYGLPEPTARPGRAARAQAEELRG